MEQTDLMESRSHTQMASSEQPTPSWSGTAFLSYGFRPFFLAAALWAGLSALAWILMLRGRLILPTALDPIAWHAHEALFGYLSAVFAGFLLTAVPNWTGRPPRVGWTLLGLLVLWIVGRVSVLMSAYLSPWIVAVLDLPCLVAVGAIALREILISSNWRNLIVVAMIGAFAAGNALFHWEAASGAPPASGYGLRIGLATAIMLISLIGGRIVPTFTRNWLVKQNGNALPPEFGSVDRLALALTLVSLIGWVANPTGFSTGCLLLACGAVQLVRVARWRGLSTLTEPLIWILHVGYGFVPIGMLGIGAAVLWPDVLLTRNAQHLWMAGAIGVMTLAVMTRATLGHTGRDLTAGAGTTVLYLMVVASVVVRLVGGALPGWALTLWAVSAFLWSCAFLGYAALYGPMMVGPRVRR